MDPATIQRSDLSTKLRVVAGSWRALLGRGSLVTDLPPSDGDRDQAWSVLEYGAHVRDVSEVFLERLTLILKKNNPTLLDWDHEQAAIDGAYSQQDPAKVAFHLASTVGKAAGIVGRIQADRWDRPGTRSDGFQFTAETCAYYLLHELTHHLHDAEEVIKALTEDDD